MKPKIFVTTGSVLEFDSLIKIIDQINEDKEFEIVAQIGNGTYKSKNIKTFNFTKEINKYYDWADLIITHTGVGTIFELLLLNKKIISINNPLAIDNADVVIKFDELNYLKFLSYDDIFKNNSILKKIIIEIFNDKIKFKKYEKEDNKIANEIKKLLY